MGWHGRAMAACCPHACCYACPRAGYDLLKKKSDALTFRFREITRKIKEAKEAMGEQMRATIFSLTEAVWAAGDFKCVRGSLPL